MFDFLQSNSQAFIIVSAIIIFGLLQLLKANKMLTEVVDKKINQLSAAASSTKEVK